jgi:hypothetical protein
MLRPVHQGSPDIPESFPVRLVQVDYPQRANKPADIKYGLDSRRHNTDRTARKLVKIGTNVHRYDGDISDPRVATVSSPLTILTASMYTTQAASFN